MKYRNKKNGELYQMCNKVLNCTNAQDGQQMIMYIKDNCDLIFVREENEFYEKFEKVVE